MTTNHNHCPRPDDDNRPPADPLRLDRLRCDCGATAGRHGLCRKCYSRALWSRRNTGRRAHADRPPSRRREPRPARRDARGER